MSYCLYTAAVLFHMVSVSLLAIHTAYTSMYTTAMFSIIICMIESFLLNGPEFVLVIKYTNNVWDGKKLTNLCVINVHSYVIMFPGWF